ncbi:hypothetical protein [Crossiella cryophila]|uniref:Exo-alpha-sialidase n=1 Tax=Crossiella cryophila TaxID=43355 RepID=A0A7W7CHF4_9PSEU|nr:hypothetical protein [Crossiella cryophila]MBB4681236.1 hypothetical protein [Crossiella cryophila]
MRRNRILLAALVLALAGTAVLVLREEAGPPPPEPEAAAEPPRRIALRGVEFADERHWFGVRAHCRDDGQDWCAHTLLAGQDGRVAPRELPPELRGDQQHLAINLVALGPSRLVVWEGSRRWFTADAGQSWTRVDEDAPPVDRIPAGAVLEPDCTPTGCAPRVLVVLPESGRRAELRGLPPLGDVRPVPHPDAAGRWRVVGTHRGRLAVADTADAGRGWQVRELPPGPVARPKRVQLVFAGHTGYLLIDGEAQPQGRVLQNLYRGDGQRWELRWHSTEGRYPNVLLALIPRPDGRLTGLDQASQTWVSEDSGRSFRPARPEEVLNGWAAYPTRSGHLLAAETDTSHSPDGVTWTLLPKG